MSFSTFSHQKTRGRTRSHLEMSGNLSFTDEKAAVGVTFKEINERVDLIGGGKGGTTLRGRVGLVKKTSAE